MESTDDLRDRVTALEATLAQVREELDGRRTAQVNQNRRPTVEFSDLVDQVEQRKIKNIYNLQMESTPADYFDLNYTFSKGSNPTKKVNLIENMYHDICTYLSIGEDERTKERAVKDHLQTKLEKRFKRARSRRTEVQVNKGNRRNRRNSRKNRVRDRRVAVYKKKESELVARNPLFGGLCTILACKEVHSDYESDDEPAGSGTQERGAVYRKSPSYRSSEFNILIDSLESEVQRGQRSIRSGNQPLEVVQEKIIVTKDVPRDSNGDYLLLDWMYHPEHNRLPVSERENSIDRIINE